MSANMMIEPGAMLLAENRVILILRITDGISYKIPFVVVEWLDSKFSDIERTEFSNVEVATKAFFNMLDRWMNYPVVMILLSGEIACKNNLRQKI